jgi:glycosyltransferase involved in cell wall biosynthesis
MSESSVSARPLQTRKVLVCRSRLLPYSETFIREQALTYSSWVPVFVGTEKLSHGLPLDPLEVRIMKDPPAGFIGRAYKSVCRRLGWAAHSAVMQLRSEAASLVHIHFATDAVQYWPMIRRLRTPIVITLHGYDINTYREWWTRHSASRSEKKYPDRLLSLADDRRVHFVAVSQAIRRRAIEFGLPPDRVHVRYIGIDLTRFRFSGERVSQRRKRVLFVGRFVEKKGGEYLIRAFARVRSELPDAELVMAGDGKLLGNLQALAQDLDVPVTFLGKVSSEQVIDEIHQARVFCLPSVIAQNGDAEGLPISILEAQASGVPVVTSARGADEGIIDGTTGYMFPERDVEALAGRLLELLTDDVLADSMSQAGPEHMASRFDIRQCTQSLESLYEELLGNKRRPIPGISPLTARATAVAAAHDGSSVSRRDGSWMRSGGH